MDHLSELAAELARLPLDVIVAVSSRWLTPQASDLTIPIVFSGAGDPVATGLIASFSRPGGNMTGVSALETELSGKRIDLLKEAFPKMASVAVLWNSADRAMTLKFGELERAAHGLRVTVHAVAVREATDFDSVFADMTRKRPDALFVITDPLTLLNRKQLLELATKSRLPAMYENSSYTDAGGLMAYGPTSRTPSRQSSTRSTRFLKVRNRARFPSSSRSGSSSPSISGQRIRLESRFHLTCWREQIE